MRGRLDNLIDRTFADKLLYGDYNTDQYVSQDVRHKSFSLYGMEVSLADGERERLI